jgi:hypothetical protein
VINNIQKDKPMSTVRRVVVRTTLVATMAASGTLAFAGPASADVKPITEKSISIQNCNVVGSGQVCPANPDNWAAKTQFYAHEGSIKVEFTGTQNGCSDIIAHVYFDGDEWGSNRVGPGQGDGGYEIPVDAGLHQVGIQAEGLPGGCNTGSVSGWGGTLRIWQVS